MKKRYWLRGLMTGIVIYVLTFLVGVYGEEWIASGGVIPLAFISLFFLWPVIPIGWIIGLVYGKYKKPPAML